MKFEITHSAITLTFEIENRITEIKINFLKFILSLQTLFKICTLILKINRKFRGSNDHKRLIISLSLIDVECSSISIGKLGAVSLEMT
ncbi:hypothetical protein HanRHA438_Chr08g0370271 [Helianthus annuus]|nr:hypothetical protein HanRHA438_Chr08g0370271 [Helianthus annuus]